MSTSSVLALRLEAPLQAWGDSARWSVRDTRPEPTFSGVIGLLAAAQGWRLTEAADRRLVALSRSVRLGVRADREGSPLRDYQTVGGTRSGHETPWTGLLTAEGKTKRTATTAALHTEVSERNYLCDACFLVMLEAEDTVLARIEAALQSPVWPPYLGRKACVPSVPLTPVFPGKPAIVPGPLGDAISAYRWLGRETDVRPQRLRVVLDERAGTTAGLRSLRHDVPMSFGKRLFAHRYVRELSIPMPSTLEEA
jgi:CRISPR system Cascade subunit CasD